MSGQASLLTAMLGGVILEVIRVPIFQAPFYSIIKVVDAAPHDLLSASMFRSKGFFWFFNLRTHRPRGPCYYRVAVQLYYTYVRLRARQFYLDIWLRTRSHLGGAEPVSHPEVVDGEPRVELDVRRVLGAGHARPGRHGPHVPSVPPFRRRVPAGKPYATITARRL